MRRPKSPQLVLSPLAWLKLLFLLHAGDSEVGAFGVSDEDDLLYIEDLAVVRQKVTWASVEFDDQAVAEHAGRIIVPAAKGLDLARPAVLEGRQALRGE